MMWMSKKKNYSLIVCIFFLQRKGGLSPASPFIPANHLQYVWIYLLSCLVSHLWERNIQHICLEWWFYFMLNLIWHSFEALCHRLWEKKNMLSSVLDLLQIYLLGHISWSVLMKADTANLCMSKITRQTNLHELEERRDWKKQEQEQWSHPDLYKLAPNKHNYIIWY